MFGINSLGNERLQEVNQVLESIFDQFNSYDEWPEKIIQINGKTFKVANIVHLNGRWEVSPAVSRGMFVCNYCTKLFQKGDNWTQISRGEFSIKIHCSMVHIFKFHPEKSPSEEVDRVAKVLL